jgi:hypothetical protein
LEDAAGKEEEESNYGCVRLGGSHDSEQELTPCSPTYSSDVLMGSAAFGFWAEK